MRPKDPGKTARMRRELREELKGKKTVVTIYIILRVLVILTMVAQFLNGNFENVFLCILTLVLFTLPTVIERRVRIDLPDTLEIIILLFIFSAEILGEIQAYYTYFHGWDTMLHTLNGFLCAAIGFSLVDLFNRNERFSLSLSPVFMAIVAFCFSMTIGVLWEFFECIMDSFFLLDMQKDTIVHDISTVMLDPTGGNKITAIRGITDVIVVAGGKEIPLGLGGYLDIGLLDTMKDLFVNFIGAFVFSIIGYFYGLPAVSSPRCCLKSRCRPMKKIPARTTHKTAAAAYTRTVHKRRSFRWITKRAAIPIFSVLSTAAPITIPRTTAP